MKKDRNKANQDLLEWYDALIFALLVLVIAFILLTC